MALARMSAMTSDDDRLQREIKYMEERLQRELKSQEARLRSEFKIDVADARAKIAESQYEKNRWIFVIGNIFLVLVFALFLKVFL
jgi:hypothetical protein